MDVNEIIESGMLEAYVLGTTTEVERQQVEAAAQSYEIVRNELANIETILYRMAEAQAIAPPAHLQDSIWNSIEAGNTVSVPTTKNASTPIVSMAKRSKENQTNIYRIAAVCIGVLCMASIALNLYFNTKLQNIQSNLFALTQKQDSISKEMVRGKSVKDSLSQQLSMATNPNMKMVHLNGLPIASKSHVMLYWDTQTKDVFVHVDQLPTPADGKQYQLWAIIDGKPVDAGMITAGGMLKMKNIDGKVQAFAITLEKTGGNPTPTMDQMYVLGKV